MISIENRFFPLRSAACFLIEGGIILFSVVASFIILQKLSRVDAIELQDVIVRGVVVAFFCQSCMYMLDLYDLKHSQSWGELFFCLVFSIGIVCIGIGLISYVLPEFGVEGRLYYLTIVFVALLLLLWRLSFDTYLAKFAPKEKILIVGTGGVARSVAQEVRKRKRLGFNLVGFIGTRGADEEQLLPYGRILGDYSNMLDVAATNGVRNIIVAFDERRGGYPVKEMLALRTKGCRVLEWTGFFEKLAGRIPLDSLMPSYFIFNQGFRKTGVLLLFRRVVSVIVAVVGLVAFMPFMLLVAVAIKLDSRGPVLYSQDRVGMNGKIFRIYKFRSMRSDAEKGDGPRWASKDDPRITNVGGILRKNRIDELPQLFNVLKGDLDLVGPRPEQPEFVRSLQHIIPYYSLRHTVPPGLTGWAQVMFTYCGTIEESREKLQYDLFYIKNMSIKLDLLIIFWTAKIVILGRGAR